MLYAKLLVSGNIIEFYQGNYVSRLPYTKPSAFNEMWRKEFPDETSKEERNRSSFYRSRRNAKRIIFCNAWQWFRKYGTPFTPYFLTLTFSRNITDLTEANRIFSKFIQRFNYELGYKEAYLQYFGVPEFQERGAVHYHVIIFNLPYIKNRVYKTIFDLWGEGRIELKKVNSLSTLINYLSKYMVKESEDGRLAGRKRYFTSRNIKRSLVISDPYASVMVSAKLINRLDYKTEFEVPFAGLVKYQRFILQEGESLLDLDLDHDAREAISSVIKESSLRLTI